MAYKRTNWKDHVVERPRTYTEAANSDGSKTFTPAPARYCSREPRRARPTSIILKKVCCISPSLSI